MFPDSLRTRVNFPTCFCVSLLSIVAFLISTHYIFLDVLLFQPNEIRSKAHFVTFPSLSLICCSFPFLLNLKVDDQQSDFLLISFLLLL